MKSAPKNEKIRVQRWSFLDMHNRHYIVCRAKCGDRAQEICCKTSKLTRAARQQQHPPSPLPRPGEIHQLDATRCLPCFF